MLDIIENIGSIITAVLLVLFAVMCFYYRKADRIVINELLSDIRWHCDKCSFDSLEDAEETAREIVRKNGGGRYFWVKATKVEGGVDVRVRSFLYWGKTFYGTHLY